ncbi:MAG: antitoxin [Acidobacteriota bacterium]|nr:antitoxin [Acidobacteriota bacterium]MDE2965256.1 antitoxin [Acidobacteriota bacterium]
MRTTLDIDDPILRNLKQLKKKQGKSMGRLVSDLLVRALREDANSAASPPPVWIAKPMGARVNLSDKEEVYRILDR